jgi:hypothetical protein
LPANLVDFCLDFDNDIGFDKLEDFEHWESSSEPPSEKSPALVRSVERGERFETDFIHVHIDPLQLGTVTNTDLDLHRPATVCKTIRMQLEAWTPEECVDCGEILIPTGEAYCRTKEIFPWRMEGGATGKENKKRANEDDDEDIEQPVKKIERLCGDDMGSFQ